MPIRRLSSLAGALMTVAIAATGGLAHAQQYEQRSVVVGYGDLDLGSPSDLARLDQRLRRAAHKVCDSGNARDIGLLRRDFACRNHAIDDARGAMAAAIATHGSRSEVALLGR